jgi:flagellar motor switch protein FliN
MSFSASPMVPGQRSGDAEEWAVTAQASLAAVAEGLPQIPAPDPLTPGEPIADPAIATLPEPAGTAITALVTGIVEGQILLVLGQELVDALKDTPFGSLEAAQAVRPAMEAMAASLGGQLSGQPTAIDAQDCLEVLVGGSVVIVPLMSGPAVGALAGFSFTLAPGQTGQQTSPGSASAAAQPGAAGTATGGTGTGTPGSTPGAAGPLGADRSWGIEMLRDVEMEVTCELGRTRMTVRQLLALAPGDVVELDRLAGSPADLLVNGTLLARGEVVVVDESFGLRITEIVTRDAT